jgi:hypothetical protein
MITNKKTATIGWSLKDTKRDRSTIIPRMSARERKIKNLNKNTKKKKYLWGPGKWLKKGGREKAKAKKTLGRREKKGKTHYNYLQTPNNTVNTHHFLQPWILKIMRRETYKKKRYNWSHQFF